MLQFKRNYYITTNTCINSFAALSSNNKFLHHVQMHKLALLLWVQVERTNKIPTK